MSPPPNACAFHPDPSIGDRAVEIDATAARLDHRDLVTERPSVEGRVQDAIVRREACEREFPGLSFSQHIVQSDWGVAVVLEERGILLRALNT